MRPKLGVDAVGGDDDVGFGRCAVGERHPGRVAVLLEFAAAMSGKHRSRRQGGGQHVDKVGAVHAEGRVPAGGVRHLHRGDRRAVVAEVMRVPADPRAPFLHRRLQSDPLQMPHAVRRQEHAGADLADRGRLLVHRYGDPLGDQRIGCEQSPDPASDDRDTGRGLCHDLFLVLGSSA